MKYEKKECKLNGCIHLVPEIFNDIRGESIKTFHVSTFKELGIDCEFKEDLIVVSHKNVFRGMHFQKPPYEQEKIVYCIKGKILDIILDLRKGSPTYGEIECIELSESKKNMLFIPSGFAHGYIALEKESIMFYKMSNEYNKEAEDGICFDSIKMPIDTKGLIISERDQHFGTLQEFESPFSYELN